MDYETGGDHGTEGFIYQALVPLENLPGVYLVVRSWVIGHEEGNAAAGMGIREFATPVTANLGQFVPHLFA